MFASQFLNVVLDDTEESDEDSGNEHFDDFKNNNIMEVIKLKSKLPNVLLSECTIELCNPNKKKKRPELCFKADLTPIYKKKESVEERKNIKEKEHVEDLLQGVEAVYSDEGEESDQDMEQECTKCNFCGRSFNRNCSLAIHLKSHCTGAPEKPAVVKAYRCETCGKSYSQKSVLKKHLNVHSGDKLRCSICGIDFTQRSSLLRHCKRIHKLTTVPIKK